MKKSQMVYAGKKMPFRKKIYRWRYLYLLLLPACIYMLIFEYLPMPGIIIAFQDYDYFKGFAGSEFVGLDNFKFIFQSDKFLLAIKNTLVFGACSLTLGMVCPMGLALLFNEIRGARFKKIVQTISYLPHFISWASITALVYAMFGTYGTYNDIMAKIFGSDYIRTNPLINADNFMGFALGTNVYKTLGWATVIYMAAIAGIDSSLYEAAEIDGASRWQKMWNITLPGISQTAVMILIMSIGSLFGANFELIYGLQNVFTQDSTEVIGTLVYRTGLINGNYSLAIAFSLFQGVVHLMLVLTANKISRKVANLSIW